jgi:hypothetical protein
MRARRSMLPGGIGLIFAAMFAISGVVVAQEAATPVDTDVTAVTGRPAHIHSGTCDTLGDVVAPLTDLTLAGGGTGTGMGAMTGMSGAIPAEYSFTNVPLALDDILAADHAVNIHESAENIGNYIACAGLTGGTVDANGSLVVGVQELNGSGYTGIAVLTTNAADPGTTDVSVFIASNLSEQGDGLDGLFDEATPATPGA